MQAFAGIVRSIQDYEDPAKLDRALSVLPLDKLFAEAAECTNEEDRHLAEEDRVVKATLKWFKTWFEWVNSVPCERCGTTNTTGPISTDPLPEERRFGALTVELWHCDKCGIDTRFPRYNDALKLLETRKGRCGEWCNSMQLILRALGRDVRYVWNSEDHVWNEVWSPTQNRWIHIDSCEAAFDNPLIYSDGWGKKMAYVIGFSIGGARDITQRYVRRSDAALPRIMFHEEQLQMFIAQLTAQMRQNFDAVELVDWYERDEAETRELQLLLTPTPTKPVMPRQSGAKEWTEARGEAGPNST